MPGRHFPPPTGTAAPANSTALPAVTPGTDSMVLVSNGTAAGTGYALRTAFQGPAGPQGIQGPPGPAGSGTGTSFTPGRSLSLVGGTLDAGGWYNVRSYGAIGDGTARTLSQMASFRGQNTSGWTLAQWQAVLPHVTALSNQLDWACIVDAVRACKAAGGGIVYAPKGAYVLDAGNALVLSAAPTTHLWGDIGGTTFLWLADMGAGKTGIVCDNPGAIEAFLEIRGIRIQGNGNTVAVGTKPYQMCGVELDRVMRLRECFVRGFGMGAVIVNDHQQITHCKIDECYYNVYFRDGTASYGNQYFAFCDFAGAKFASIAVGHQGSMDTVSMLSLHLGFAPYGIYKEAAPAGQDPVKGLLTNSTLIDVSAEACGNAGIYDENRNSDVANNALHNVNIDLNPWGNGAYIAPGRAVTAAIHCGRWSNNRVTGSQELVVAGTVHGRVTQGAIVCRGAVAANDFGRIANWIGAAAGDGKPYLLTGDYAEGNAWRGNGCEGLLAQVVEQSATVPTGTAVRFRYGTMHALPWEAGAPLAGVLQMPGVNNAVVPVAVRGRATVRKTAAAVVSGTRMVASLAAPGAAEARSPGVSSPTVGAVVFDAAAGDATVSVVLDIHTPRHIGAVPSLTYSRATENAAQAQLRAAMVAQGLAVDATTA